MSAINLVQGSYLLAMTHDAGYYVHLQHSAFNADLKGGDAIVSIGWASTHLYRFDVRDEGGGELAVKAKGFETTDAVRRCLEILEECKPSILDAIRDGYGLS